MYWLALRFPVFSLDVLDDGVTEDRRPRILLSKGRVARVLQACQRAQERGIYPGMGLSSALALVGDDPDGVVFHERNVELEKSRLQILATWAGQFTSKVVLREDPPGLLLEIGGSEALFGHRVALVARIVQEVQQQGIICRHAAAPIASAAWALAGGGREGVYGDDDWLAAVCALPVTSLDWPSKTKSALRAVGLKTIAACLRQPRDGFVRRYGKDAQLALDRLTGQVAEPLSFFEPPPVFRQSLTLYTEISAVDGLLMVTRRLLVALEGFLRGRGAGLCRFDWVLEHPSGTRTSVTIRWGQPAWQAERMLTLLRRQVEKLVLAEPVASVAVEAEALRPRENGQQSLFMDERSRAGDMARLIDELAARLGGEKVFRIGPVADSRPGRETRLLPAWQVQVESEDSAQGKIGGDRPLWINCEPAPAIKSVVAWQGESELIETGWWDGAPMRRIYRCGISKQGAKLWLYRDLDEKQTESWRVAGWWG